MTRHIEILDSMYLARLGLVLSHDNRSIYMVPNTRK